MNHRQEVITAATLVIACGLTLWLMMRMGSGMTLPPALFRVSTWWRAMRWTAMLTAAAVLGAVAASGAEVASAALAVGAAAVFGEAVLMSYAKTFGPKD